MSEPTHAAHSTSDLRSFVLALHDQTVELRCPESVVDDVEMLFGNCATASAPVRRRLTVRETRKDRFTIAGGTIDPHLEFTRGDLPTFVMEAVVHALVDDLQTGVALHAGAIGWNGRSVLIAGPTGAGKSSLVAWLVENGFEYLTDEVTVAPNGSQDLIGFPRSLVLKPGVAEWISALRAFDGARPIAAGTHLMVRPHGAARPKTQRCGLIVFPRYVPGSEIRIQRLSPAQASMRLIECNLNARNLSDGGFATIAELTRTAPAVLLTYGDFDQLQGTVDVLIRLFIDQGLDPGEGKRFLSAFASEAIAPAPEPPASPRTFPIPQPTPKRNNAKLTIGMATYDDYDGVYFTLQALRLYHPEVAAEAEFLVVDNHPDGPCSQHLKNLETAAENFRYVPVSSRSGPSVRDFVFEEAAGELVVCMDCHVFVVEGALQKLVAYFDAHPHTRDILQGPLLYDGLDKVATHFSSEWRGGMYGYWATDARGEDPEAEPFEIPMQGCGLFACRRAAWPGFNPRFRGFGGEEGYIHEKFRQRGGRALCLPFLRWVHRFNRPLGLPYQNCWEDRIRNYLIGFAELGLDTDELERHFSELLGAQNAQPLFARIKEEMASG